MYSFRDGIIIEDIGRVEAERRLKDPNVEGGTFIVRESESDKGMIRNIINWIKTSILKSRKSM